MKHRPHVVERTASDGRGERVTIEIVVEAQGCEVAPLLRSIERVDDENAVVAAFVERPDNSAADEARAAGDEDPPCVEP
jgi:hypothetical protein